ncbi:AI-2E family transporter [Arthrobacter sp. MSA 4-2]|uniref:AI-2E family transporter n=1 Tax=Arthrobacter sp. MSA 4-2 TaxID=2794349 RepID=UPI0018E8161D|nr:AI-2E family transporter [Arthrobacter sp. MSA 4-2]
MSVPAPDTTSPWKDSLGRASLRSAQVLLMLLLAVVTVYALIQVRLVVIPILLALILASAIVPLVHWLRRKGWPASAATGFSFLLLLLLFGGLITGIVFAVQSQAGELVDSAVRGFDQLYAFVENGPLPIDSGQIQQARDAVVDFATSSTAGAGALSGLSAATNFIAGGLLMAVILFYFLKDGEKIWAFMLRAFKGKRLVKARRVGYSSLAVLGGYVRGTAIVALVDAVFIGIALVILNIPLALPLAVIVFIGAFIPLVGATLAGVLAALVALVSNGPTAALIVIIVVIVVNQLEGNFLQPVVMGRTLSVHALVILLALTAGTILAGIIGAILSVPVAAVTWAAIKAWNQEEDEAITETQIIKAEQATALDESGHGLSTLPKDDPKAVELAELADAKRSDENRPGVASRGVTPETEESSKQFAEEPSVPATAGSPGTPGTGSHGNGSEDTGSVAPSGTRRERRDRRDGGGSTALDD